MLYTVFLLMLAIALVWLLARWTGELLRHRRRRALVKRNLAAYRAATTPPKGGQK